MTSEEKPIIKEPQKSSMEILSELFSTFHAKPPLIIKPDVEDNKKHRSKSKKRHKHKEKKKKKKDKKRRRDSSSYESDVDLAQLLIKQEKEAAETKVKIEGTECEISVTDCKIEKAGTMMKQEQFDDAGTTVVQREKEGAEIKLQDNNTELFIPNKSLEKEEESEISVIDPDSSNKSKTKHKKHKKRKHKDDHEEHRKRHKHDHQSLMKVNEYCETKERDRNRSKSRDRNRSRERENYAERIESVEKGSNHSESKDKFIPKDRKCSKERLVDYKSENKNDFYDYKCHYKHKSDYKDCDYDFYRKRNENPFYKYDHRNRYRHKEKENRVTSRYRSCDDRDNDHNSRDRSSSREKTHIDKKKLLEIARKNAIQMMKSGSLPGALSLGPQAQEKVIAAIKGGGKTIAELTEFCKTLSKEEELGEFSSPSEENVGSDSDNDKPFHHPFQIKDRPTSITMNIKNSVPLPLKTTQEHTTELRMQFPVSSGQQHRKTEEWIPVITKKPEAALPQSIPLPPNSPPIPTKTPPQTLFTPSTALPGPQVFPTPVLEPTVDIGSIVSQRLTAMRKLQENPNDVQALTQIYKANEKMQSWAQSKQQVGQFTGSTGASVMSQSELNSGYQAWARKDQFQNTTPVSGGMGMHLLQKMGWKPGEGLGKEKTGALEPLLLEVKLDKKGLVANEEQRRRKQKYSNTQFTAKAIQEKHPVSLLGEYASKNKLGVPQYSLCFECGPDHKKNFLFKVILNGVEYKPNVASPNKKEAKANAAKVCLQHLGLSPNN